MASVFRQLMKDDRERLSLSVARASWLLGVSVREYGMLEAGENYSDLETYTPDLQAAPGGRNVHGTNRPEPHPKLVSAGSNSSTGCVRSLS
jgi:hypothetical protein